MLFISNTWKFYILVLFLLLLIFWPAIGRVFLGHNTDISLEFLVHNHFHGWLFCLTLLLRLQWTGLWGTWMKISKYCEECVQRLIPFPMSLNTLLQLRVCRPHLLARTCILISLLSQDSICPYIHESLSQKSHIICYQILVNYYGNFHLIHFFCNHIWWCGVVKNLSQHICRFRTFLIRIFWFDFTFLQHWLHKHKAFILTWRPSTRKNEKQVNWTNDAWFWMKRWSKKKKTKL